MPPRSPQTVLLVTSCAGGETAQDSPHPALLPTRPGVPSGVPDRVPPD